MAGRSGLQLRRAASVALPAVLLSLSAAVFALPWRADPPPGGELLARYAPQPDGVSWLYERRGPSAEMEGWRSANVSAAPARLAVGQVAPSLREGITRRYGRALGDVTLVEVREQDLDDDGARPAPIVNHYLRDEEGLFYLAVRDANGDAVFDPPLRLLPADLRVGKAWTSEGALGSGSLTYEYSGEVSGSTEVRDGPAKGRDCLRVLSRLLLHAGDATVQDESYDEVWCDGVGQASSDATDAAGAPVRSLEAVAFSVPGSGVATPSAVPAEPLPADDTSATAGADGPSNWKVDVYNRLDAMTGLGVAPTAPPTWLPGDPPLVVAAGSDGTLSAFDARDAPGDVRWRLHTAGIGYGPPAVDRTSGRLYFGTSDKHLYAVDARGLFLWAAATHDNVASRPAVAQGVVVFGSEDRHVYAVDAATGRSRWSRRLPGPVVSSPVYVDGSFVIGCDDGSVRALSADGRRRWERRVGAPVEGALASADGAVFVVDSEGGLTSLAADDGKLLWSVDTGGRGAATPVLADELVLVVDAGGRMHAYDQDDGSERWQSGRDLVGPPAALGKVVVAAERRGRLLAFGDGGRVVGEWDTAGTTDAAAGRPSLSVGLTAGGGAAWALDDSGVLLRLGPPTEDARPLVIRQRHEGGELTPTGGALVSTVTDHGGLAVVLDGAGGVSILDPQSGVAALIARVDGPVTGQPVVAGTTLLVPGSDTLHALSLPEGEELWTAPIGLTGWRPAAVEGEAAVAVAGSDDAADIVGIDLDSGRVRWRRPTTADGLAAGVVVDGGVAFSGSPVVALDLLDGRPHWTAPESDRVAAGLALDPGRGLLYAASRRPGGDGLVVRALDTRTGTSAWERSLEAPDAVAYDALALAGDSVVVPTAGRTVYGLDAVSGEVRWSYDAPVPRFGSAAVLEGRVWVPLVDGRVVVLDGSDGGVVAFSPGVRGREPAEAVAQRPAEVGDAILLPTGDAVVAYEEIGT